MLALPVVFYQGWRFVAPGLLAREHRLLLPVAGLSVFCFGCGGMIAYWIVLPLALRFLLGLEPPDMTSQWAVDKYVGFVLRLLLGFGLVVELPVVTLLLAKMGVVTPQLMRRFRRYGIVALPARRHLHPARSAVATADGAAPARALRDQHLGRQGGVAAIARFRLLKHGRASETCARQGRRLPLQGWHQHPVRRGGGATGTGAADDLQRPGGNPWRTLVDQFHVAGEYPFLGTVRDPQGTTGGVGGLPDAPEISDRRADAPATLPQVKRCGRVGLTAGVRPHHTNALGPGRM